MNNVRNPNFMTQNNNTNYSSSGYEERSNCSASNTSIPLTQPVTTVLFDLDPYPNSNVGMYHAPYYLSCYRCQMIVNPGCNSYVSCVSCSRVSCSQCPSNDFSANQTTFTCEFCYLNDAISYTQL